MPYKKPIDVTSPTERWKILAVIYDAGEGQIAVSFGEWDKKPAFGMRWNGTEDKPNGHPSSTAHPTWFILPVEFGLPVVKDLLFKQARGNQYVDNENIKKALEWLDDEGYCLDKGIGKMEI